jgi:hypothetical protein
MPVGVYRKRTKNGRWMYFRDGKLISKKSYDASTSRRSNKPRRATNKKKNNPRSRSYMKRMPHPSITGLASGAIVLDWMNSGGVTGSSVVDALKAGSVELAADRFLHYTPKLVTSSTGRKQLVTAIGVAALGALTRKHIPNVKLGGSKVYARI